MPIARRRETYTAEAAQKASRATDKKDPKAPKRALSAYMFFSQDWIKAENNDAGFGEVWKLLGARWKEIDDKKRKVLSTTYKPPTESRQGDDEEAAAEAAATMAMIEALEYSTLRIPYRLRPVLQCFSNQLLGGSAALAAPHECT
ncbi:hypothetical protein H0H92_004156, partial [Tricholoma furcatifolium]